MTTNPTPTNKTIDDLINRYEEMCATHAQRFNRGETDSVQLQNDLDHAQEDFKQALLTYIKEEVIGPDETPFEKFGSMATHQQHHFVLSQNKLRSEQRNRLEQS